VRLAPAPCTTVVDFLPRRTLVFHGGTVSFHAPKIFNRSLCIHARLQGGSGGGGSEESILETPTYSIALLLVVFQAVSIIFTLVIKSIQNALRKRRRLGLLAAVNHSVHELTLLGFVSIVLISLQETITSICVDAGFFNPSWTVLSYVYGEGNCPCCLGSTSYVQQCVLEYAQCGNPQDPMCNCDYRDPTCVSPNPVAIAYNETKIAARRFLLAEEAPNVACEGARAIDGSGVCSEGKVKAVSFLALEQVHLLIFSLSIVHVICGFVLYGLAVLRVRWEWGKWEKQPSLHSEKVQQALEGYYSGLNSVLFRKSMTRGNDMHESKSCPRMEDAEEQCQGSDAEGSARNIGGPPRLDRFSAPLPKVLRSDSFESSILKRTLTRSKKSFHNLVSLEKDVFRNAASHMKKGLKKSLTFLHDLVHPLIQGMGPFVVSKSQYAKLRASFIYTHKLGGDFDFLKHVLTSMEDDLSHLVGITPIFWIVTTIFWLISGVIGYAVLPAMILNAVVLVVLNAKLVSIVKHITDRGGAAVMLETDIFWFNKPDLLLQPMKFCLFVCSYMFNSFLFFVWQFSPGSCPFTDAFYPRWVIPWWTIIIFNLLLFVHLAAVTFPAYSMAVQMGSDIKGHMLPSRFVKKLMKAVEDAKREVEREKAEQQAAETSQSTFQRLFRRSATIGHAIQTGASALAEGTAYIGDQ
jgi:hypothetical protein